MATSWYSIQITPQAGGDSIFNGYFNLNNASHVIQGFYNTNNLSVNIIANAPNVYHYDADYIFNGDFSWGGTTITSIPALNSQLNATEYSLWVGNNLSYKVGNDWIDFPEYTYIYTINISPSPISNICFPAGTPVTTNQVNIPIEQLNPNIHTIRNKKIVCISKTITQDKYLVCFEKNSLEKNIPSQKTIISKNHKILYKGNMIKATHFIGNFKNVYKIDYKGEILYNVLMEEYDKMIINNLICETLHPENAMAQFHKTIQTLNQKEQEILIKLYNEYATTNKIFTSKNNFV